MRNNRKILAGVAIAVGLAVGTAFVYADPHGGFGPGAGGCAFNAGSGGGAMGRGMMGGDAMGSGMMGGAMGPGMMGNGGGYGPGAAAAGFDPAEHMEARLSFLKDKIKITSDQQAAWDAYATQVKAQGATMQAFHAQPPATAQTPAERIGQHADRAKLRAEQLKEMSAAVKELYAALTPEQKTVADRYFGGPRMSQNGYGRGN